MAHRSLLSLCFLAFLVSVSGSVLPGFGNNQIHFLDRQSNIAFQNTLTFDNTTSVTDPPGRTLIHLHNGTAWDYAVPVNVTAILTAFSMVKPSGLYFQQILAWSNVQTPYINCTTDCSWQIDDQGFSVTDLTHGGPPHFVVSWSGPYPPT